MSNDNSEVYHITPYKTYVTVFLVLLALTALTVIAANINFGAFNPLIAFAIAAFKAFLVLSYFMHLKYDTALNKLFLASAFVFLLLLFVICAIDIATRVNVQSTL